MNGLGSLLFAVAFLTRLPVPHRDASAERIGRSVAYFPAVGLLLGILLWSAAAPLASVLPPTVVAALLVALLAALTGGLHLDGLADVFDGLGGARGDRERALELMRDSRIGAHGASALVLLLATKIAALGAVLEHGAAVPLLIFPAVARWCTAVLLVRHPYARSSGLGSSFRSGAGTRELAIATAFVAALLVPTGGTGLVAGGVAAGLSLGFGAWLARRLGGLTGDGYGAAIEIAETGFLVGWLLRG